MLYGMEDNDLKEEFDLDDVPHINIGKVLIVIAIVIVVVILIFGAIFVFFKLTSKKTEITVTETPSYIENKENLSQADSIYEGITENNEINIQNEEDADIKIAKHDIKSLFKPKIPVANPNGAEEIRNIYYSDEKQVYLTFDDGPSKDITPQILDILNNYNIKATFFVLGARVDLYPDMLKREFDEGHYIANHGYSHIYSKIYESKDTTFEEYIQTEQSIKNALGNQDYNSFLFRFPGGSSGGKYSKIKEEAKELFKSNGIAFTNWNCLTGDAAGNTTKEACFSEMINTKGDQNSLIILMHDANDKSQTVEVLPQIIEYYMNEGYTFKNFYDIFSEREEINNNEEENNDN